MRICIHLLYLVPGIVGGTETYAAGLLFGLSQIDNRNEYFIFLNQSTADWPIPENENFIRVIYLSCSQLFTQQSYTEDCR